ncbi:MAG: hypothetical protein ACAH83_17645 [Alphaproteobacteria bacterium]
MERLGYVIALTLTLIIELGVYRFVLRRREKYKELCLINLVTNPVANVLMSIADMHAPDFHIAALCCIEMAVMAAEWWLLKYAGVDQPLRVSIILNLSSWLIGGTLLSLLQKF